MVEVDAREQRLRAAGDLLVLQRRDHELVDQPFAAVGDAGVLASIAGVMPTAPAYTALLAAITPAGGLGAGLAGMIAWAALAFVATTIAVIRRRTANTRALLAASPALA